MYPQYTHDTPNSVKSKRSILPEWQQYTLAETTEMIFTSAGIISKGCHSYHDHISMCWGTEFLSDLIPLPHLMQGVWFNYNSSRIVEYHSAGGLCRWNSPLCWKLACCAQFLHCWRWSRAGGRGHTSSLSKLAPRSSPTENYFWEGWSFQGSPLSEHWPLPHDTSLWALYHLPETKNQWFPRYPRQTGRNFDLK